LSERGRVIVVATSLARLGSMGVTWIEISVISGIPRGDIRIVDTIFEFDHLTEVRIPGRRVFGVVQLSVPLLFSSATGRCFEL
jgi:hypothetical protein